MIQILKLNNSDDLKRELSMIAFDKKIYKELGYPVYTDKNHVWYLAYFNNVLVGFCSAVKHNKHTSYNHDYVIDTYRCKGIYNELFKARLKDSLGVIKSTVTSKSVNTFKRYGFDIVKSTKNYYFVQKLIK